MYNYSFISKFLNLINLRTQGFEIEMKKENSDVYSIISIVLN